VNVYNNKIAMEAEEVKETTKHTLSDQVAKVEPSYGGDLWDSISILE
jgi:hypothetical protein